MLEVLIAMLLLSIGLLGLVGTAAVTTRMIGQGGRYSSVSRLASERLEMLRARGCASMTSGTTAHGSFVVTWTTADLAAGRARRMIVAVQSPTARGTRADTFLTTIIC